MYLSAVPMKVKYVETRNENEIEIGDDYVLCWLIVQPFHWVWAFLFVLDKFSF